MANPSSQVRFKVPRENNTRLIWPADSPESLLRTSIETRASYPEWLQQLTERARTEVWELLADSKLVCSCGARDGVHVRGEPLEKPRRWLLSGHQPELFHPGVWYKNFYLDWLRRELEESGDSVVPLNVIVDHDLARSTSIRSPRWEGDHLLPSAHILPLGIKGGKPAPWELTKFEPGSEGDWEDWIDRLGEDVASVGIHPLIVARRGEFLKLIRDSSNIGIGFSRFRHHIELDHGCENFETPMSAICGTVAFGQFLRRTLLEERTFAQVYNDAREAFRAERDITNPAQPVPALRQEGDWIEFPFWIYQKELNRGTGVSPVPRSKLWVLPTEEGWILANAPSRSASLQWSCRREEAGWDGDWGALRGAGICIRPRALTNTLFLRYVLADLFVHGIGGGIYDAVTDEIATRYWGLPPLPMIVASASLHLPSALPGEETELANSPIDREKHAGDLRRLRSAPESFLDLSDPEQRSLWEAHQLQLKNHPPKGPRKEWHWKMKALRGKIRRAISETEAALHLASQELIESDRQKRILQSRESSYVLFPEKNIARRLQELLPCSAEFTPC